MLWNGKTLFSKAKDDPLVKCLLPQHEDLRMGVQPDEMLFLWPRAAGRLRRSEYPRGSLANQSETWTSVSVRNCVSKCKVEGNSVRHLNHHSHVSYTPHTQFNLNWFFYNRQYTYIFFQMEQKYYGFQKSIWKGRKTEGEDMRIIKKKS